MSNLVYDERAVVEVTKEFTFDSSHQLYNYTGKCARLHGHTYKLQVTLEGVVDSRGILLDFKHLKLIVNTEIVEKLDHYNLNDKFSFNTTAENMVVCIYNRLDSFIQVFANEEKRYIKLKEVKLWETPTSFACYKGKQCEKSWEDK